MIGLHHVDERSLRAVWDGGERDQRGGVRDAQEQARVDELVREERAVRVRELRLQPDGAGARIDRVVDRQERPGGEAADLLAIPGLDRQVLARPELSEDRRQAGL